MTKSIYETKLDRINAVLESYCDGLITAEEALSRIEHTAYITKSDLMIEMADKLGLPVIEMKLAECKSGDLEGLLTYETPESLKECSKLLNDK